MVLLYAMSPLATPDSFSNATYATSYSTRYASRSLEKIYNKKEGGEVVKKGISFPVCVSVNERICNYSPLISEADTCPPLADGDMVKIDLGCHIDGYIACVAHTLIVGSSPEVPSPTAGDVCVAAHNAMLVAAATIKPGAKNTDVTKAIARVAEAYGVKFIATVRSHQMKQVRVQETTK